MTPDATPLRAAADRVDIGALAAEIQRDTADRIADTIAHSTANLAERDGTKLTELQHAALIASALRHFDGFETDTAAQLKRELEKAGVETWGLPDRLERLLGASPR